MLRSSVKTKRVHRLFLRTPEEMRAFVKAFLNAQGFNTLLRQYQITNEMYRSEQSIVMLARHRILNLRVVIKFVPTEVYYKR